MKYILLFTLLLCLCGQFNVNCGLLDGLWNWAWGSGSSGQVSNEIALILAVEINGWTYLANNQFVASRMNQLYYEFLFLCPAETPNDSEVDMFSRTKNVLFIKKTHQNKDKVGTKNDIITHTCVHPVMPSIIKIGSYEWNPNIELYLVGYEVFFGDKSQFYHTDAYHSAGLLDERFAWFNVCTIAFNRVKRSVVSVFSHSLAYKNDRMSLPMETKLDYSLGAEEFYKNFKIFEIYDKEYQENVFEEAFHHIPMPFRYVDAAQDRYLAAIHLAHLDSFGIPIVRLAGQTYANIAPMWNIVYNNAWWNIETHLDTLARGVYAISVITGVYETLKFSNKEVYLGPDETVEAPAAFFKIVSYSPNTKRKYNMVIVTSNNPYIRSDRTNEKICKKNQCKDFGWEYVEQDFFAAGRTTCCELTSEVLTELKLDMYSGLIDNTLDLNRVLHWRNHELTLNVKAYMVDQISGINNDKLSDDEIYKNQKDLSADREDEDITFKKFITTLYENYESPHFSDMNVGFKAVVENPPAENMVK